jgi:undecaprenyl diphosphate synthase
MSTRALKHIAVIMDGNGRWARQRGWPRTRGHLEGANAAKKCVEACLELGIEYLTLYTFSTENWRRPKRRSTLSWGFYRNF